MLIALSSQYIKYLSITENRDVIQNTSLPGKTVSSWSIVMFLLTLFDFITFAILGLWWPKLAWKLSGCSPGKREMGASAFSSLGWTAIQLCLSASALTTQLKLSKGFGCLLWPLHLNLNGWQEKTWNNFFQKLKCKPLLRHFPLPGSVGFSRMLWAVMAIPKSFREFGIRNLLLTTFEQPTHFVHSTMTLLPQKCNHELFPWYISAKAPREICATLRIHGDLRKCSWSLHLFSDNKTSKMIFADPVGWWPACHQAIKVLLCYFYMLK